MELVRKCQWKVALLAVMVALCVITAAPTDAGPRIKTSALQEAAMEEYGPNDGPAFLMISVTPDFDVPYIGTPNGSFKNQASDYGSRVVLVNVGKFLAGDDISTSRFESPTEPINVVLPLDEATHEPISIDGNQATIVGSFKTVDEYEPVAHLMTPDPQPVDPATGDPDYADPRYVPTEVQEAYFNASRMFTEAQYPPEGTEPRLSQFPTTVELAYFIWENQGGAGADFQDILEHVFQPNALVPYDPSTGVPQMRMSCVDVEDPPGSGVVYSICEAEGELFPHEPGDGLFRYKFKFDEGGGTLTFDVVLEVNIDIKPGNEQNTVNLGSEGNFAVAIYSRVRPGDTDATFLASEVDPSTIRAVDFDATGFEVTSVSVDKYFYKDINGDGYMDLQVFFRTAELREEVSVEATHTLIVRANLTESGMLIQGSDTFRVVPDKN